MGVSISPFRPGVGAAKAVISSSTTQPLMPGRDVNSEIRSSMSKARRGIESISKDGCQSQSNRPTNPCTLLMMHLSAKCQANDALHQQAEDQYR